MTSFPRAGGLPVSPPPAGPVRSLPGGPGHPFAPTRARLPDRRLALTEALTWCDRTWLVSLGFDPGGRVREIFISGGRSGSEYEALMADACVLLSLLLQVGVPADELAGRLGTDGAGGAASSPVGAVARLVSSIEAETAGAVAMAYAAATAEPATLSAASASSPLSTPSSAPDAGDGLSSDGSAPAALPMPEGMGAP